MTSQHDTGTSILLESGTNELEVVEFYINNIRYGVNVAKVEEVRYLPEYRSIPQTSKKFMGFFNLRGKVIP
ncbi:MAG: chemotaxis protein CheW, partial [SAR324 cluster bacterium]|nr:chemotaxis protein CheW [SAR324 cluster bacterium]